jgi:glycosyltransferase involved in cell wall biosynthesis
LPHPLVSVIIPTFNRASTIVASVKSVHQQTFDDLEIIVVDDGSSDDTKQLLQNLALPGLRYILHDVNKGANAARNTGIEAAKGKFVAFQDSDDIWHKEKLAKQIRVCLEHNSKVAFCAFNRTKEGKSIVIPKLGYNISPGYRNIHQALLRGSFISCQTLLVTKAALTEVGKFDTDLPRLQDWELCLRLSKRLPFAFLDEVLVEVEVGKDGITAGTTSYAKAANLILKKHADDFEKDRIAASMLCMNVAIDTLRTKQYLNFLRFASKAVLWGKLGTLKSMLILFKRR